MRREGSRGSETTETKGSEAESKQEMKNSRIYPEKRNLSLSVSRKVTG